MRDLHPGDLRASDSAPTAAALLRVDPLATVRALVIASAPLTGRRNEPWSVATIADAIGERLSLRAVSAPPLAVVDCGPLHRLWLHALATANAAETLAHGTGLLPPGEAHLLGLLHSLPLWLDLAVERAPWSEATARAALADPRDRIRRLGLPASVVEPLEAAASTLERGPDAPASAATQVLLAAQLLAELAGFPHPGGRAEPDEAARRLARDSDAATGSVLRDCVAEDLRAIGLDLDEVLRGPTFAAPQLDSESQDAELVCIDAARLALRVLGGDQSLPDYRAALSTCAETAVTVLGYDRALYGHWIRETATLVVHDPGESPSGPSRRASARLLPADQAALQKSVQTCRPFHLSAATAGGGVLDIIGASEALVVPVNRKFHTPSFLIVDRTLSGRPLQLDRQSELLTMLGVATGMRVENMLLERRARRSAQSALVDPLTRLWNRRMGIATLDQAIARSRRSGTDLTVLMIDLDQFKKLNDTYGHVQGDVALRTTADVLRRTLRRADTISRYGGEEFMVVLAETSAEEASLLAARLFVEIEARGQEVELPITVSIGQATLAPKDTAEGILSRADRAL
ncbi:MAG: diguanylate cyclase, partial [Planctomycetota bacterium]